MVLKDRVKFLLSINLDQSFRGLIVTLKLDQRKGSLILALGTLRTTSYHESRLPHFCTGNYNGENWSLSRLVLIQFFIIGYLHRDIWWERIQQSNRERVKYKGEVSGLLEWQTFHGFWCRWWMEAICDIQWGRNSEFLLCWCCNNGSFDCNYVLIVKDMGIFIFILLNTASIMI